MRGLAVAPENTKNAPLSAPDFPAPRRLQYQLLFLAAVHGACSKLFSTYATGAFQAKSAVMAHYVPFLICFVGMAAYGDYLWLADDALGGENFDKTWGFHAGAEAIVVSMLAVQLYDIPVSLSVDDLRVPTFIAHHFAVLYLAVVVLKYRCFYYYAVYFLGVVDRVDIKSSTRLQCARMRPFRREAFCRASRTRRAQSIRPKISRIDFDVTEIESSEVWWG